jgi:peptidoglycan/xylan/chitin deacetylase (PgdA/CDA1 family)
MRLDRTLSLRLVHPLMRMGAPSPKVALPILMYHGISDDPEPGVSAYYKTNTSPALFERHLRCLNGKGFRSIGLEEGIRLLQQGGLGQEKVVVITFDDGFRDFYDRAFPVLKKYGHTATVFIPTAFVGETRRSFKNKGCLTWKEVRELRTYDVRFGSHTVNHPILYKQSWKEIEYELAFSKEQLERELDEEVTSFAYPYAFPQQDRGFTEKLAEMLRERGYQNCVTSVIGRAQPNDDLLCLKRLPINNCDDVDLFVAKLNGAYDWLMLAQSCVRLFKTRGKVRDWFSQHSQ